MGGSPEWSREGFYVSDPDDFAFAAMLALPATKKPTAIEACNDAMYQCPDVESSVNPRYRRVKACRAKKMVKPRVTPLRIFEASELRTTHAISPSQDWRRQAIACSWTVRLSSPQN